MNDFDSDLILYGVAGYPGPVRQCGMCGMDVVRLTLRQRGGNTTQDLFEVVKEAECIKDATFLLHSDIHTNEIQRVIEKE